VRPIFELGVEPTIVLDVTRRLREFGLDLCAGVLDGLRTVLVRPGKARLPGVECDWTLSGTADAWLQDDAQCTTDALFDRIREYWTAHGDNTAFDFESHREFGDRDDALRWIAAETDAARRSALERFIARFPGAVFFREDDAFHAMVERHGGIALPASYRRARSILAGAFPERRAEYRVDCFEGESVTAIRLREEQVWYRSQFEDYANDAGPMIRDAARLYPFAFWRPYMYSMLAVSLDGDQPDICEYREEDIFHRLRIGQQPSEGIYRVYPSYAALLGHIIAFKLDDATVVEAEADAA
jgi:hypothetical protein